jgi:hypothetical protein
LKLPVLQEDHENCWHQSVFLLLHCDSQFFSTTLLPAPLVSLFIPPLTVTVDAISVKAGRSNSTTLDCNEQWACVVSYNRRSTCAQIRSRYSDRALSIQQSGVFGKQFRPMCTEKADARKFSQALAALKPIISLSPLFA